MSRDTSKNSKRKALPLLILGLIITTSAITALIVIWIFRMDAGRLYDDAEATYVTKAKTDTNVAAPPVATDEAQDEDDDKSEWWDITDVDLDSLKSNYPGVIGWIYSEDGLISYPLVYSGDNEYYLRRSYTGAYSPSGSIFLDGESSTDLSDPNSLIYGHNMRDGSMFGSLRYYLTEEGYRDAHGYLQVILSGKRYRYKIIDYKYVSALDNVYYVYGKSPAGWDGLVKSITNDTNYDAEADLDSTDHILTLSTCTSSDTDRMVVYAMRVDEH